MTKGEIFVAIFMKTLGIEEKNGHWLGGPCLKCQTWGGNIQDQPSGSPAASVSVVMVPCSKTDPSIATEPFSIK